ncbi:hypothetical protein IC620_13675 [Hazenella sp. IB182357]|uniref:Uncharacterized protein n=1 Tax=Polycladospora coralii TaxID=2771432 RepID=A0A926N6P5_9BACL|nr:hypothetical protein [Polycladospora coralii]MBD1373399.1 hypothetical protein [Polycladospora coralii]
MSRVEIIYVEYPDGSIPVYDLLKDIGIKAKRDPLFAELSKHVWDGFDTLELKGVPDWKADFSYDWMIESEQGWTVRVDPLVKRLNHAYPLFEMRVNEWREIGARKRMGYGFRVLFFTYNQDGTQYIFLVNGMVKQERSPAQFEKLIAEALHIYNQFLEDREAFLE